MPSCQAKKSLVNHARKKARRVLQLSSQLHSTRSRSSTSVRADPRQGDVSNPSSVLEHFLLRQGAREELAVLNCKTVRLPMHSFRLLRDHELHMAQAAIFENKVKALLRSSLFCPTPLDKMKEQSFAAQE